MLNKKELEIQIKADIEQRGCILEEINNDDVLTGYIINEDGAKEDKIIGAIANDISLSISHKLINIAIKNETIELGIIQTPDKRYYIDMSTGMQTDNPKKFITHSEYEKSEESIKRKIGYLEQKGRRKEGVNIINYLLTPI